MLAAGGVADEDGSGFGGVGILNTFVDYAIFNIMFLGFDIKPFTANIVSTTVALSLSYFLNNRYVFKHGRGFDTKSAVLFVAFTLFGLWVIQGAGLAIIIHWMETTHPSLYANHTFLIANGAKLFASAGSIIWNFTTYNSIVFKTRLVSDNENGKS